MASGFGIVHAFPLRLRDNVIGAMNVFGTDTQRVSVAALNLARAFADAATIGILQERAVREHSDLSAQLQGALESRVVVEQAKGIVAERLSVDMDQAFTLIRKHARINGVQLSSVATSLIEGSLTADNLGLHSADLRGM
jgi:GAF domain-containing protein